MHTQTYIRSKGKNTFYKEEEKKMTKKKKYVTEWSELATFRRNCPFTSVNLRCILCFTSSPFFFHFLIASQPFGFTLKRRAHTHSIEMILHWRHIERNATDVSFGSLCSVWHDGVWKCKKRKKIECRVLRSVFFLRFLLHQSIKLTRHNMEMLVFRYKLMLFNGQSQNQIFSLNFIRLLIDPYPKIRIGFRHLIRFFFSNISHGFKLRRTHIVWMFCILHQNKKIQN